MQRGYLYIIGVRDQPYIKVGITRSSVEKRLRQLCFSLNRERQKLIILDVMYCDQYLREKERTIHMYLREKQVWGEWYSFLWHGWTLTSLLETAHNDLWRKQKKGDKHANFLLWRMRLSDR